MVPIRAEPAHRGNHRFGVDADDAREDHRGHRGVDGADHPRQAEGDRVDAHRRRAEQPDDERLIEIDRENPAQVDAVGTEAVVGEPAPRRRINRYVGRPRLPSDDRIQMRLGKPDRT